MWLIEFFVGLFNEAWFQIVALLFMLFPGLF